MEFFTFEPSDFQVLEDIEFDETVQRPEKVRFYTLEEQTVDAFEKMIPKGRVTKFQLEELKQEVERIQNLYNDYVVPTTDAYTLREPEVTSKFDWVFPVYASPDLKEYDFNSWASLYDNPRAPNFYPRMLTALPRPFAETQEGIPYPASAPTEFLNENGQKPLRALPIYSMTRTQVHEDKTIDIVSVPVVGTADDLSFKGYYLAKRPLDIPNPFPEHPFLKANEPTFVPSTAEFKDVAPSMDAILTHGVPVTKDPYREAYPYLKIYDIKLGNIPWSSWKSKFPQAEPLNEMPPLVEIGFPKPSQLAPPEKVIEKYKSVYNPGISVRKWLSDQLDGGELIPQMLLSAAFENGSVASVPGIDLPTASYPSTTPAECNLLGVDFQTFVTRGLLRRTWGQGIQCVPLEFVRQERAKVGYTDRIPWKEETPVELLKKYSTRIEEVRPIPDVAKKIPPQPKTPARPDSLLRKEILAIESDTHRLPEDKVRDISELLKETTLTNQIYSDQQGLFAFCSHTLALLSGDMEIDRQAFYSKWTVQEDGFRVCKFCGERTSTLDLVEQEDFDDDGFAVRRARAFEESGFIGSSLASFTTGLRNLKPLFVEEDALDETVYLLLSILQVLPSAQSVDGILKAARGFAASKKYGDSDTDKVRKGALAISATIVLLQSHSPALIPRRSFGSRPLKLNGYPRDAPKPEEYSIVDSMILVLRKTFEAYPTVFKGPSSSVINRILNKPNEIKTATMLFLDKGLLPMPDIRKALDEAKGRQVAVQTGEDIKALLPVVMPPKEFGIIKQFEPCPSERPIWTSGREPEYTQPTIQLASRIYPVRNPKAIETPPSVRESTVFFPKTAIQGLVKKKTGLKLKLPLQDAYRTNLAIASRLADVFLVPLPVRTIDPNQNKDELRDIAQGMVFEVLQSIQSDPVKRTKFEELKSKDITLYTLFANYKEEKAQVNKLKAQERIKLVEELGKKTDLEREVIGDLLKIGLAPYIITQQDRILFAEQAEALRRQTQPPTDEEIGIGIPMDQGEIDNLTDRGDYGDYTAQPSNDGRDNEQPTLTDDSENTI